MSPGKIVFGVVSSKNDKRCPKKSDFSLHLSPVKTIIGAPGKVVYLHYTTVYIVPASQSCPLPFVPVET